MSAAIGLLWGKDRVLELERGATRFLPVENCLWKRLWTCSKMGFL